MTITQTNFDEVYENGVVVSSTQVIVDITTEANLAALSDRDTILAKIADIKTFLSDTNIQASLDRPNAQMPTAQEINRTLKELIRQARKTANLDVRAMRYVFGQLHPELLNDVTDT